MKMQNVIALTGIGLSLIGLSSNVVLADQINNTSTFKDCYVYHDNDQDKVTRKNVIMIDVARRKMNESQIIQIIQNLNPKKFQFIQLHLNDNENFSVQTRLLNNQNTETALSIQSLHRIVSFANQKGITVIPDVDVPSHDESIINEINKNQELSKENLVMDNQTLDYTNPNTEKFVEQLYAEILPAFSQQRIRYFMIGADEVPGNGNNYQAFCNFLNQLNQFLNVRGFKSVVWNDCLNQKVLPNLDRNITVDYWSPSDANTTAQEIANHGNPVKDVDYQYSYYNTIDLNNQQLEQEKSNEFAKQKGNKMLCLWGSNNSQENTISNQQIIDYINEVQKKM